MRGFLVLQPNSEEYVSNRKKKKDLSIKSLSLLLIFPQLAEEGVTQLTTTQV